jgi:hypothetical protein
MLYILYLHSIFYIIGVYRGSILSGENVLTQQRTSERLALLIAFALMIVGLGGVMVASIYFDFILLFTFVELTSVSMFFILLLSFIPAFFPDKVKAESVFYCGLAKEPYMSDDQVYRPNVPLLDVAYDYSWDEYYDKKALKVEK